MDVTFEKVTKKKAALLRKLAPMRVMASVGDGNVHTIAAITEEDGKKKACAVMQYALVADICYLAWLFVETEYREKGLGKEMLEYLYKDAKDIGAKKLQSLIYQGISMGVNLDEVADYLIFAGFDEKSAVDGLYCISGKELLENINTTEKDKLEEYSKSAISFSKLTPDEMANAASSMGIKDTEDILSADKALSCVYKENGKCMGLLAFKKRGHLYWQTQSIAVSDVVLRKMFWYNLYNAFRHLHINDNILVVLQAKQQQLLSRALPVIRRKEAVLVTKVI